MTDPTPTLARPNVDGGPVGFNLDALRGGSYVLQPQYQLAANAAVQLPWQIDLAGSYLLRQGFGMAWCRVATGGFRDPLGSVKELLLAYPNHPAGRYPAVS